MVRHAIESRRREFATARACARDALVQLGLPSQPIPAGPQGNPIWPPGIVGSISHCDGYRVAAVANERDFVTIGIDVEPSKQLPDGVLETIASADEVEWVRRWLRDAPTICWDRLLFSIKEAVYKAWFPLTAQSLGFEDANIVVDPACQEFSVQLHAARFMRCEAERLNLSGRWSIGNGLVATAIVLPAS